MAAPIVDFELFQGRLAEGADPLPLFRDTLAAGTQAIKERFERGEPVSSLVGLRADLVDLLLTAAWRLKMPPEACAALIAVGGYGRRELHPGSDIDLMILLDETCESGVGEHVEALVTFFWDIGLGVGHSVRTLAQSVEEATQDVTVATNLMESRLLTGPAELFDALREATGPDSIWPSERFFEAKREEQRRRYLKYDDTVSNLEPNVKESPGGLRDIQTIGWVAKRHFGAETMNDLVMHDFLTEDEYLDLMAAQEYLWRVRFALHVITGRGEDRLLFDHQRQLAAMFGYEDDDQGLAVEKFMQLYYQTALRLSRMNEMLLQLFQEAIVFKFHLEEPKPINERFQARSGYLEVVDDGVFRRHPLALLELFLVLQQHQELNGVRAKTIRLVRRYRYLINEAFRADPSARALFMHILRQRVGITRALRLMNRYGILARYLPAFHNIVGRMQYDLFHVYTVDEHTLFVIRNIRRFAVEEYRSEYPLCSDLMDQLPKPELIYLAALFHDIAKGRGGDHSVLGEQDALAFCERHGVEPKDAELVAWLVRNHLVMSMTAQRKDIGDPEVVNAFADNVASVNRLDYLYLLTVADIRATDPKKWNSWKNSLLRELYQSTKQALLRGPQNPQDQDEIIQNKQAGARHLLKAEGVDGESANRLWMTLSLDYFLHHSWDEIAWQTKVVLAARPEALPLVLVRKSPTRGGTEVFVYGPDKDNVFAITTGLLVQLGLNVLSARIETSDTGYMLNSFLVLENDGSPVNLAGRREEISGVLRDALSHPETVEVKVSRLVPRQVKHFSTPTRIEFDQDYANGRTILKLVTDDRPGLLSQVGQAFSSCRIRLINAKIATIGATADDTFYITDRQNRPLTEQAQFDCVKQALDRLIGDRG